MKIINTRVYGLDESLIRSGYPMQTEIADICDAIREADWPKVNKRYVRLGSAPSGSGHDKFLRGIIVQADIIAPRYFWQEWDTYHFCESISSQSTMHCAGKFKVVNMGNKYVDEDMIYRLQVHIDKYIENPTVENLLIVKSNWLEGIELGRGISTNYNTLKTMHNQRKNHKLPEWNTVFEGWLKSLPLVTNLGVIEEDE